MPFLIKMSDAEFAEIPKKVVPRTMRLRDPTLTGNEATVWILDGYANKFLYKNQKLDELFRQFAGRFDDPGCRSCFTQGQRILHVLTTLDGEVKNGGLTQFFWNQPDLIFEVPAALETIGEAALAAAYREALKNLISNQDDWLELRKKSNNGSFWEPFEESYALLELESFDEVYLKTHGPSLMSRLMNYVKSHKEEFIES